MCNHFDFHRHDRDKFCLAECDSETPEKEKVAVWKFLHLSNEFLCSLHE